MVCDRMGAQRGQLKSLMRPNARPQLSLLQISKKGMAPSAIEIKRPKGVVLEKYSVLIGMGYRKVGVYLEVYICTGEVLQGHIDGASLYSCVNS